MRYPCLGGFSFNTGSADTGCWLKKKCVLSGKPGKIGESFGREKYWVSQPAI